MSSEARRKLPWFLFWASLLLAGGLFGVSYALGAELMQALLWAMWGVLPPLQWRAFFASAPPQPFGRIVRWLGFVGTSIFTWLVVVLPGYGYQLDQTLLLIGLGVLLIGLAINRWLHTSRARIQAWGATLLIAGVAAALFVSRCTVMPCEPRSWAEQRAFALAMVRQQGAHAVVDGISASVERPASFWFSPAPQLRIAVAYALTQKDERGGANTPYRRGRFSFNENDPQRSLEQWRTNDWYSWPGSDKWQAALDQTQLEPRDALLRTLAEGTTFLHRPPEGYDVTMRLVLPSELAPELATPAVWEVRYHNHDAEQSLELWVDARSGTIVRRATR